MNILFTFEPKPTIQQGLQEQNPQHDFVFQKGQKPTTSTDVWVTYGEDVKESDLDEKHNLKWISVASAGIEKMPLEKLSEKGIVVTNARGIHKTPMAESILGHILALYRNLPAIYQLTVEKEWRRPKGSRELKGSKAVIIGPGAIGEEVARLLSAFGVTVVGCNRSGREVDSAHKTVPFQNLVEELEDADNVLSLLPSTADTKHALTKSHFKAMKANPIFMNFGRGDVADEAVLVEALENGWIRHAVLDVFEIEPLPKESPLWSQDNVTISPHVSSHSDYYVERALEIFSRNLIKWEQGESDLENQVDLKLGY